MRPRRIGVAAMRSRSSRGPVPPAAECRRLRPVAPIVPPRLLWAASAAEVPLSRRIVPVLGRSQQLRHPRAPGDLAGARGAVLVARASVARRAEGAASVTEAD